MEINTVDALRFVMYAMAVFRVSYLLWWENGPWDVVDWLRAKVGIRWEEVPIIAYYPVTSWDYKPETQMEMKVADNVLAKLLSCPLCISLWLALPAAVLWYLRWWPADLGAVWLAMGTVPLLLYGYEKPED